MTPADAETAVRDAIDAAHPAGMCGEEFFDAELRHRLDLLAQAIMASRPDLKQMSLDEYLIEHFEVLTDDEREAIQIILAAY